MSSIIKSFSSSPTVRSSCAQAGQLIGKISFSNTAKAVTSFVVGAGVNYLYGPQAAFGAGAATFLAFDNCRLSVENRLFRRSQGNLVATTSHAVLQKSQLQLVLDSKDGELEKKKVENKALRKDVGQIRSEKEELTAQVKAQMATNNIYIERIGALTDQDSQLGSQVAELQTKVVAQKSKIDQLTQETSTSDISSLELQQRQDALSAARAEGTQEPFLYPIEYSTVSTGEEGQSGSFIEDEVRSVVNGIVAQVIQDQPALVGPSKLADTGTVPRPDFLISRAYPDLGLDSSEAPVTAFITPFEPSPPASLIQASTPPIVSEEEVDRSILAGLEPDPHLIEVDEAEGKKAAEEAKYMSWVDKIFS